MEEEAMMKRHNNCDNPRDNVIAQIVDGVELFGNNYKVNARKWVRILLQFVKKLNVHVTTIRLKYLPTILLIISFLNYVDLLIIS